MTGAPVIRCVDCGSSFTDEEVKRHYEAAGETCPKCGTSKRPQLIGAAACARLLADEYLAVKPNLAGRAMPPMSPEDMSTRQNVGLWIVNWGRECALQQFDALPKNVRRGYEKKWPGFRALLAAVCWIGRS